MALEGCVIGVTGNFDRQILTNAVQKAGGRVDAIVHKNLHYVREPSVCAWGQRLCLSLLRPIALYCSCSHTRLAV
jgi:hypothetical protein